MEIYNDEMNMIKATVTNIAGDKKRNEILTIRRFLKCLK
jgi:hypothetical protein